MMDMVEEYLLERFPEPFRKRTLRCGDVYFMVEHGVESVAHRSGRFWPFRGRTWTEEVHEFRVACHYEPGELWTIPLTRVRDVKPGSGLFFDLCRYKDELFCRLEEDLSMEKDLKVSIDKRIHTCMDSFREMCRDE